ncbi:hypothetical protein J437_LFUL004059 [Ladona fulva]|uniref:tRNA wybutosine-synthesizing protein 4 n=1 Tax=Ladona fulva TaxID=123851 RepID=A0A8K0JWZ8_LADFU|nr:hypothetical protein J437_LFUL004059 [Ladona fulva]
MFPRSEVQIQGTSDSCTLSKSSMAERGYLKDPYIKEFVSKTPRRSPLINLGYFARAVAINTTFSSFLECIRSQKGQIISCGAGFDSNYFVLAGSQSLAPSVIFVEIDFPEVAKKKKLCIDNSPLLRNLMEDSGNALKPCEINGKQYKLIGCDLKKIGELTECLRDVGVNFCLPTLFFSECAITYMRENESSQLIQWAAEIFENASFVNYEQIHPDDGFGMVMTNHFKKLHSPLLSIAAYPSIPSQNERYKKLGWSSCSIASVMDIFSHIVHGEEYTKILNLEPFDEFEELHLKCSHYSLSAATKGSLITWKPLERIPSYIFQCNPNMQCNWTLVKTDFLRYYHASCMVNESDILVVGGFGPLENGGNSRISTISVIRLNDFRDLSYIKSIPTEGTESANIARVHHSLNFTSDGKCIVFGGRTSPLKPLSNTLILSLKHGGENASVASVKAELLDQSQSCPSPRWRFSAVIIKRGDKEELMVFGGRASCKESLGDLWVLDTKTLAWQEELFEKGPEPRFSHSATVWASENKVLITGGLTIKDSRSSLSPLWSWDFVNRNWEQLSLGEVSPCQFSRYGHNSVIITSPDGEDLLLMVGGVSTFSGKQCGIGVFNLSSRILKEYALPELNPEYPILLFNHTCHLLPGSSGILIVGGGGTCFSFGTSFNHFLIKLNFNQFFQ